jgi:hypothetical protein
MLCGIAFYYNYYYYYYYCCYIYRRLPAGGLHELRAKHELGWAYFDSLVMLSQAGATLSAAQRAFGTRYVVASLWVFAENARPMAIEKLLLSGLIYCC